MGNIILVVILLALALAAAGAVLAYVSERKKSDVLKKKITEFEAKSKRDEERIHQALEAAKAAAAIPVAPPTKVPVPVDLTPGNARASDALFATLSHELRTPLNGVLGLAQILNDDNDDPNLVALEGCARQMRSVIHTLVNLSKIKADWGNLPQYREWVSLHATLERCKQNLSHRASTRGLRIVLEHENQTLRLRCDLDHLETIIETAILGSIECVDPGDIPEKTRDLSIKWKADEDKITVTIVNPLEQFIPNRGAHIAEVMRMEDGSHDRIKMQYLYWAVSSSLLEHYDGAMMANSRKAKEGGVRTVLAFSMKQMQASPSESAVKGALRLDVGDHKASKTLIDLPQQLSVLVAEDDPMNRKLMKDLLERMNQKVTFACNGQEVLDITAEDQSFDVILMDIDMPILDGVSTAFSLREGESGDYGMHIPIVALTAFNTLSDQSKFKKAGMNHFLPKPVGLRALRDVFYDVIREKAKTGN